MNDPQTFLEFLQTGRYLPAIGIALIAIVGLARVGLAMRWDWFRSKLGGYVLGFGSALLLYVGAAFRDGAGVSLGLLAAALGAGWAASGGWEAARDLLEAMRKSPPTITLPRAAVVTALVAALTIGSASCKPLPDSPLAPVVDCTLENQGQIESVLKEFSTLLVGDAPNWSAIEEKATLAGVAIGGCALAEYVQHFLGERRATPLDIGQTWPAAETLERFRAEQAGGATFHTAGGDL